MGNPCANFYMAICLFNLFQLGHPANMNKMGKLASKVATARLARAQMALDKHNRLIEGAKLSKEARKKSIKSECEWAGLWSA